MDCQSFILKIVKGGVDTCLKFLKTAQLEGTVLSGLIDSHQ